VIDPIILEDIEIICREFDKEEFHGKLFLVTGGAGFIGSFLVDVLLNLEAKVDCIDNFSTGKLENLSHLVRQHGFKLFNEDVCSFKGNAKYDYILHMASHVSPEEYQRCPIATLQSNSLGSFAMLELARKSDATILFASTSEIYGDPEVLPTPESYAGCVDPVGARSCYREGKRFAESLFTAYNKEYDLNAKIARIFNTYGPRMRSDGCYARVVPRFTTQALAEAPLTIYGDGKQTRSFCYITDTVNGLMLLATDDEAGLEVVNIGNPVEITILELAQKIIELTKSKSKLTFCPMPEDDPKKRCPNTSKMEKLMGWKPKISLEQGLKRTVKWFARSQCKLS